MKIESLRQRIGLLVLLPVGVLLLLGGVLGFMFMRDTLLREWEDAAIIKLQGGVHEIDARLMQPREWIEMFCRASRNGFEPPVQQWILEQIKGLEGVTDVRLIAAKHGVALSSNGATAPREENRTEAPNMVRFFKGRIAAVTPPVDDDGTGAKTVSIVSELLNASGAVVAKLVVSLDFNYLIKGIKATAWWQTEQACIMDDAGRCLARSEVAKQGGGPLGEAGNPFKGALLKKMTRSPYGTFQGPGRPPQRVGGFYRLSTVPWAFVLVASSEKVLAPMSAYRNIYFVCGVLIILFIFYLNQFLVQRVARSLTAISSAAGQVAEGRYGKPLPVRGNDEIARLTRSFNHMVDVMKERDRRPAGK